MLDTGLLLVVILASLSVMFLVSLWQQKIRERLPPGPTPLPFIGNYLQLNMKDVYSSITQLSERYGPVFTIHLGPRRIVVLYGYDAVKEALVDQAEEFSGRGELPTFNILFKGYGFSLSNVEQAKRIRRFTIATLRDFGVGKRDVQECILEEAGYLIKTLQGTCGAPIDPSIYLSKTVSNVINSIVFGNRFDYEDKEFLSLLEMIDEMNIFAASATGQLYDMFHSVMKYLPGPQQQIIKVTQKLEDFMIEKVRQNHSTLDPNSPRNFIDSFLIRMQEEKYVNSEFHMNNLVMSSLGLLFAGTGSVSSTLYHGFLLLMKHPDVEAKVHEEIERVIGRNRQPQYEDHMKMPYTQAVINEIQRFSNLAPLGIPRRIIKNTTFRGFFLPKGTDVFPIIGSLMTEPKFFPNHKDFNPQHFLDDKGQLKKNAAFLPFSIGKRFCLGDSLAKMELFLLLTTILQNFRFKFPMNLEDINEYPSPIGFTRIIPNYTMSFMPI
ncbi:rCG53761 [Rattus norvegicus]|uniref:Cytochrome P450 2A2 n=3 Tax=Rattus norvegicus TaxID=10116 RepID=CP2A2_RAT|nr:cytochrome P450 2A2 [Rattus norvegicus]P15149.1 RecName: Full=Cytochrome P450 2A2; AltName: Full=CYPIIA2; AltName: Full=Cytochrome P450-UT-4; AltName: Full=Testosterone 15-alpha-hydroxylase [Rattus norvegicus]AAA41021.1 hepatic steroid hydroxylase IIA2 (CYP2A2) [Rattus norvegicus]AAA41424.1 IIA2 protein [Rattus norvegicus]AAH89818.1 Cytochrome P450, subfamily 2A, polypeptide 1 [Rattus norvegicus]EDM07978.1 rCG53761 [Rattus norvegicus]|eukprot:NP_036825.1 cytochrome P450 2A2 [Rattus norvegicus]